MGVILIVTASVLYVVTILGIVIAWALDEMDNYVVLIIIIISLALIIAMVLAGNLLIGILQ